MACNRCSKNRAKFRQQLVDLRKNVLEKRTMKKGFVVSESENEELTDSQIRAKRREERRKNRAARIAAREARIVKRNEAKRLEAERRKREDKDSSE